MPCKACGHRTLIRDDVTENLICDSCGTVQDFNNFQERTFNINGPTGVFVNIGSSGYGSVLKYKEKKIYEANNLIDDIVFKLGLTGGSKVIEIRDMIERVTEGEFGSSESKWFSVFVGACVYVVMRNDNKSLSIEEVSSVVGCDIHELGRMVMRVVEHVGIKLPDFDIVGSFERVVRSLSNSGRVEGDLLERVKKQGTFLVQCAVKWFLTTGRRPLPVVVAVLVLVAELNGVEGVKIEELAREVHVAVSTCRLRYKELLEVIVKLAQEMLPWGKDVNMKNAVKNAPFVIRYLEMKCIAKSGGERNDSGSNGFDLGEVVGECLKKNVEYGVEEDSLEYEDLRYFELEDTIGFDKTGIDEVDKLQLSHECLSMIYDKFLMDGGCGRYMEESGKVHGRKRKRGLEIQATEWWNGKSELSKKLLLKQLLEKDVGFSVMPPSFVNGCTTIKKRRAKINAAKLRIDRIMNPQNADSGIGKACMVEGSLDQKRKRKSPVKDIDWEDFVIETLLLHQVKQEEIEKGYYNTLLDLMDFMDVFVFLLPEYEEIGSKCVSSPSGIMDSNYPELKAIRRALELFSSLEAVPAHSMSSCGSLGRASTLGKCRLIVMASSLCCFAFKPVKQVLWSCFKLLVVQHAEVLAIAPAIFALRYCVIYSENPGENFDHDFWKGKKGMMIYYPVMFSVLGTIKIQVSRPAELILVLVKPYKEKGKAAIKYVILFSICPFQSHFWH
ncbi:unnamed protein product [Dovyalis caffra]|uniref:BRF2-like C-terminal domain-containing protein n=1 Tax=Dovyalis caffra TaxID=77055 RepID=A0AAV1RTY7_9ROSI|nr:unnamed protein product [Dovyalis caffra]